MQSIGVFSDSHGDVEAFDGAVRLLQAKGARRFFFLGGRYSDLEEWLAWKQRKELGGRDYTNLDFLADVSNFLSAQAPVERPPAFGGEGAAKAKPSVEKEHFVRTPERDSLHYRDPAVPKKVVDMLGTALCCLAHDKNELDKEDLLNASVFLHGKESEPKVVQIGPRFFVAPGSLTGAAEQTCGLIEEVERKLVFSAFTLEGRTLISGHELAVGKKTKLDVK